METPSNREVMTRQVTDKPIGPIARLHGKAIEFNYRAESTKDRNEFALYTLIANFYTIGAEIALVIKESATPEE